MLTVSPFERVGPEYGCKPSSGISFPQSVHLLSIQRSCLGYFIKGEFLNDISL